MRTIKQTIRLNALSLQRVPEEGDALEALATSFAFALEDIPSHHLRECFRRAIQTNTSDFPLTAAAVIRVWNDIMPELRAQAASASIAEEYRLKSGQGSIEYMGLAEFKLRHNLPIEWRLGDAYPPESDLYQAGVPLQAEQAYRCERCKDARWVKDYPTGRPFAKLEPCPDCY